MMSSTSRSNDESIQGETKQNAQRRIILSEEEFTATLSQIVQRDYFPDLPKLERQAAVLERRAQGDFRGAVAVRRAARRLAQHEEALTEQEVAEEHDLDPTTQVRKRARPLHQETLTGFHTRATNEDDQEFDANQKQQVQQNRQRLALLFRPENEKQAVPLLTDMASDQYAPETNRITASEWNPPAVRNAFFDNTTPVRDPRFENIVPSHKHNMSSNLITSGERGTTTSSQLSLMPPPANVAHKGKTHSYPKHALVEYIPKKSLEKRIEPSQTRFPNQIVPMPQRRGLVPDSGSDRSETDDGSISDVSTDIDAPLRSVEEERLRRQRKVQRANQAFVRMTPLIVPGEEGNKSPITTWGTIDSTPIVLSGQEETVVPTESKTSNFAMPAETFRDQAARTAESTLAKRAIRAKEASKSKSDRLGSLTPAISSLWNKSKPRGQSSSRLRDSFGSSLRSSYTPKGRSQQHPPFSRSRQFKTGSQLRVADNAHRATPLISKRSEN